MKSMCIEDDVVMCAFRGKDGFSWSMDDLLELPTDILAHVMFSFFTMSDLGRLDVAISQVNLRFLLYLVYPFLDLDIRDMEVRSYHVKWYFDRSIPLKRLFISKNATSGELFSMLDMVNRGKHANRVEEIHLDSCCQIVTKGNYTQIMQSCTQLHCLNLSKCKYITKSFLLQLDKHCPLLHSLDLSECKVSDVAVEAVANGFLHLHSLLLPKSGRLTEAAAASLALLHPALSELQLGGIHVTDDIVVTLAQGCQNITSLSLMDSSKLTNAAVKALADHCSMLTSVVLANCTLVTGAAVSALARGCPVLHNIDLSNCLYVTNTAIETLAQHCPSLECLILRSCILLTDAAMIALASSGATLLHLDVSYCAQLTDAAILALSEGCPRMITLNVQGCDSLTSQSLVLLFEDFSSLHHIGLSDRLMFEMMTLSLIMGLQHNA